MKFSRPLILCQVICLSFLVSYSQPSNLRLYIAGHSLIDHRPPSIATPSNETTVPHWLHDIAEFQDKELNVGGQYGFLTNHDDLTFFSQWGYDNVPSVWESDQEPFGAADINAFMITAANFIQYVAATENHPLDGSTTVVEATERIFDWVASQESNVTYYIYTNWPEMDLAQAYPPTQPSAQEVAAYHQQTIGTFNDWWEKYQEEVLVSRPAYSVRLIPVGPIISKLLTGILAGEVPFSELYEDSDPHGRPTLYFLAGAISYMAMYEERISSSYQPSNQVHQGVRANLQEIFSFIWDELQDYNLPGGESRVFRSRSLPIDLIDVHLQTKSCPPTLAWQTANAFDFSGFEVEFQKEQQGQFEKLTFLPYQSGQTHYQVEVPTPLSGGDMSYRLKLVDEDGSYRYSKILSTDRNCNTSPIEVYPNPVHQNENLTVTMTGLGREHQSIVLFDLQGRKIIEMAVKPGDQSFDLLLQDLSEGIYILRSNTGDNIKVVVIR